MSANADNVRYVAPVEVVVYRGDDGWHIQTWAADGTSTDEAEADWLARRCRGCAAHIPHTAARQRRWCETCRPPRPVPPVGSLLAKLPEAPTT